MNFSQLGLAPAPFLMVKPEKPGVILPVIGSNSQATNQHHQTASGSRILIQQQQQQAQPLSPAPVPSSSPAPPSNPPRISIAIRPRGLSNADASIVPAAAAAAPASPNPVTAQPVPAQSIRIQPTISTAGSGAATSSIPISIPIRRPNSTTRKSESFSIVASSSGTEEKQTGVNAVNPTPSPESSPPLLSSSPPDSLANPLTLPPPRNTTPPPPAAAPVSKSIFTPAPPPPQLETAAPNGGEDAMQAPGGAQILVITREEENTEASAAGSAPAMEEDAAAVAASRSRTGTPALPDENRAGANRSRTGTPSLASPSPNELTPRRGSLLSPSSVFSAANASLVLQGTDERSLCGVCEQHPAEVHCTECALNLCIAGGCNRTMHAPRKMRAHTRVPLVAGVPDVEHALRPSTAASNPGSGGMRPGSSAGGVGRGSILSPTSAATAASGAELSPQPPPSARRSTARGSFHGQLSPAIASQLSPQGRASPSLSPLPPAAIPAPSPSSSGAAAASEPKRLPDSDSDSDSDDQTDSLAVAKELHAASLAGAVTCDQCHLAVASVFCIDCASSLCDPSDGGGCNRRIHKARNMARHRQVRIEEREEILAQMDQEEAAIKLLPQASPPHAIPSPGHVPRSSFIAPLSSSRHASLISPTHRNSLGGGASNFNSSSHASPNFRSCSPSSRSLLSTPTSGRPPLTPTGLLPRPPSTGGGPSRGVSPALPLGSRHQRTSSYSSTTTTVIPGSFASAGDDEPEFDPEFTAGPPGTAGAEGRSRAGTGGGLGDGRMSRSPLGPTPTPPGTGAGVTRVNRMSIGSGASSSPTDGPQPPGSASTRTTDGEEDLDVSATMANGAAPAVPAARSSPQQLPQALSDAAAAVARPCDNCDENQAGCYCVECKMYLCTSGDSQCQQLIHRPTRMKAHQIFLMAPMPG